MNVVKGYFCYRLFVSGVVAASAAVKLSSVVSDMLWLMASVCVCGILGSVPRKPGIEGWLA